MAKQIILTQNDYGIELETQFVNDKKKPLDITDYDVRVKIIYNNETIDAILAGHKDNTNGIAYIVLEKEHLLNAGLYTTVWSVVDEDEHITAQENLYYFVKDVEGSIDDTPTTDLPIDADSILNKFKEVDDNLFELNEQKNIVNESMDITNKAINDINEQLDKNKSKINLLFNENKSNTLDFTAYDYIIYDTFNRPNSKNIGSVENSNSIQYVEFVDGGTDKAFKIENNKLTGIVGSNKRAILGVDCGYSDNIIIEAQMKEYVGIAFRVSDANNFIYAWYQNDRVCMTKFVLGGGTELLKYYIENGSRANKLTVELNGDKINLYLDDVFINSITESFNKDKTIHGIYNRTDSGADSRFVEIFSIKKIKTNKNIQYKTLTSNIPFNARLENAGLYHSVLTNEEGTTFTLKKSDNFVRSEISMPYKQCNRYCEYSVDIKLEGNYEIDAKSSEIITQFHNYNISNILSPVLALHTSNGSYVVSRLWSEKRNPTSEQCKRESDVIGSYFDDIGKWVNWKYRINWGYTRLSRPFIEIYKNGILVYSRLFVPNCVNELYGVYFKCGVYKWDYVNNPNITNINERAVSFRNLTILDN